MDLNSEPADPSWDLSWLDDIGVSDNDGDVAQLGTRIAGRLLAHRPAWARATRDPFILRVLDHGAELPLRGGAWPDRHIGAFNCIPAEHLPWARHAIRELVTQGAVSTWSDTVARGHGRGARPHCIMPLIVAEKPSSTATNLKLRLIHDCRYINGFLNKIPFSMERLSDFVKQLRLRDRLFAIDISSAYHHVMIAPRFRTLLGFTFEGVDYVYDTLCFGLSFSAYVFCRMAAVTANALRTSGLVTALINYCDDFIGSIGPVLAPARVRAIVEFFLSFGWVLQPSKLVLTLGHTLDGLGFTLNTARMEYSIPARRQARLLQAVDVVLSAWPRPRARDVCRVVGHILSCELALGLIARLRSRYLILSTRAAATAQRYNDRIVGSAKAFAELLLWKHDLRSMPPQPFVRHRRPISYVLASDASDHALGALVRQSPGTLPIGYKFYRRLEPHERTWSSCLREMTGYAHGFAGLSRRVDLRDTGVEILGDHQACEVIFAHGGSQRDDENGDLLVTESLIEILTLANHVGCEVTFRWVRRDLIQDADDLSKDIDRMDFSLAPHLLASLRASWGPWDIDRFAHDHNATCARFNSKFDSVNTEAVDAFSQCWSGLLNFVLPDFNQLDRILDHIERDNAAAILIVPAWHRQAWWHRLCSGAWTPRILEWRQFPPFSLVANNDHVFYGDGGFNSALWALRIRSVPDSCL